MQVPRRVARVRLEKARASSAADRQHRREFEFAELANLIELACAVYLDAGVHGAAREMLEEYLIEVLEILRDDDAARKQLAGLMERPSTFKYLKRFLTDASVGEVGAIGRVG